MEKKFTKIKEEYDNFIKSMLEEGKLPYKVTSKGIWGISVCDEIFEVFKRMELQNYKNFLDIGSGDGRVVAIASLFTKAHGIEIDPELHNKALEIKEKLKLNKAEFMQKDFFEHDLSDYDVVFSFSDTALHRGLEQKLKNELKGKLMLAGPQIYPVKLNKVIEFRNFGHPIGIYENTISK